MNLHIFFRILHALAVFILKRKSFFFLKSSILFPWLLIRGLFQSDFSKFQNKKCFNIKRYYSQKFYKFPKMPRKMLQTCCIISFHYFHFHIFQAPKAIYLADLIFEISGHCFNFDLLKWQDLQELHREKAALSSSLSKNQMVDIFQDEIGISLPIVLWQRNGSNHGKLAVVSENLKENRCQKGCKRLFLKTHPTIRHPCMVKTSGFGPWLARTAKPFKARSATLGSSILYFSSRFWGLWKTPTFTEIFWL